MKVRILLAAVLVQLGIIVVLAIQLRSREAEMATMRALRHGDLAIPLERVQGDEVAALLRHVDLRFDELRHQLQSQHAGVVNSARGVPAVGNAASRGDLQPPVVLATGNSGSPDAGTQDALELAIATRSWTSQGAATLLTGIDAMSDSQRIELMRALVQAVNRQELRLDSPPF